MYHVVASDLDGTLLSPDHTLSPFAKETLKLLTAQGIHFVFATGRHHLDVAQIRDSFSIEYKENGSVSDFFLTPTAKDTLFDSLRLSFKDNLIYDMQLSDAVGQRTNILFMSIRMNEPLDDGHFVFQVPDGVDVIEE